MIGKCVYLKESFTPGSEEHVLQAALGARWKNGDFISPKANAKFSVMDAQLIETVHPFRVLLGAEGQYGPGSPLKNIPDKEGRKYRVESGGDISLSEPFVEVESLPDGSTKIHAQIANSSQAQWAAAKIVTLAEQANPGKTLCQKSLAEAIHQQGEKVRARLTSPLHFQLKLGGLDALRAITKSAFNLLAVSAPHLAIKDCFDPVRRFILDGDGNMEDFIRWGTGDALNQPSIGPVDHFLAVWSDRNGVWGHCQLYGALLHPIKLSSEDVGEEFAFSYLVDPLREAKPAEHRNLSFQPSNLQRFDQAEEKPGPPVWAGVSSRTEKILAHSQLRMAMKEVERIIEEMLTPHDGKVLTAHMMSEVSEAVASYVASLFEPRDQSELN
ncbi:hypothetical protein [Verrucomicrobium spinosum]|uniref:hypothetical protein n=1 Tax=Verrucomicrobium spinosum TaxID=2736 RepID=UPI0001744E4D|nr:hypothetical protein [Verrucomicrobium spinosum]